MRKTIIWQGKKLIYSPEHHGYIDPEEHGGAGATTENVRVWRFRRTKYKPKRRK